MREKIYIVKKSSNMLHIKGFCGDAVCVSNNEAFYTEEDALKAFGRSLHFCKKCDDVKEQILQNVVRNAMREKEKDNEK